MDHMKNIYLIIGEGACGKSSLVRALTGVARYRSVEVGTIVGSSIQIAVWIRSAQEAGISPEEVLSNIQSAVEEDVLLTLRIDEYNGQPNAEAYLEAMMPIIKNLRIVFLSEAENPRIVSISGAATLTHGRSLSTPVNVVSRIVSNAWGWV
jgi:energy-coupling factor transporter ATP-binding protein EcfA2